MGGVGGVHALFLYCCRSDWTVLGVMGVLARVGEGCQNRVQNRVGASCLAQPSK